MLRKNLMDFLLLVILRFIFLVVVIVRVTCSDKRNSNT